MKKRNSLLANRRHVGAILKLACAALLAAATAPCATDADGVTLINQASLPTTGNPYVISKAGSYRLTSQLSANKTLISIQSANVTLDLNGFTVFCAYCQGSGIDSQYFGTTILNGYVQGTGATGTGISFAQGKAKLDRVTVSEFSIGVSASNDLTATNSTVTDNGAKGISCNGALTLSNSNISNNVQGVFVNGGSALITGNSIVLNSWVGVTINGGLGAIVTNNIITLNVYGVSSAGTVGMVGLSSNLFTNNNHDWNGPVSMKNNMCSGGVC